MLGAWRRSGLLVGAVFLVAAWLLVGSAATTEAATPTGAPQGYWLVASDGGIFPFGTAGGFGSTGGVRLNQPIVAMAATPTSRGYWLVAGDGGIFPFGDAGGFGSTGGVRLNKPIVGMASTPDGAGYWLVASDGGIFPFGDAGGFGSTGGIHLNRPIVGMASTPDGGGYWLVASDGGIFPFGDAVGFGSTGAVLLNKPMVGMAATPDGGGYWLVASDGGIFPFGDAGGFGSTGGIRLNEPIVGMASTADGLGYWLVASDGGIFPFGDASGLGSLGGTRLNQPIVGMAATVSHHPVPSSLTVTTNEDTPVAVTLSAADPNGLPVTSFTIVSPPANGSLSSIGPISCPTATCTATVTYTPSANVFGTDSFTYSATDIAGTSVPATVGITVTQVNDAPSFTKGADQTVLEDSGAHSVSGWATAISAGPNESSQTVHFNVTNNTNSALFSAGPAISPTGTLTYTLAPTANGSATVTIDLQDDGGTLNGGVDTSPTQTFVITVGAVNHAPSFTKGADDTQLEDTGAHTVTPWATAISPGPANESGQSVHFNVTNNSNAALFSAGPAISPTGALSYTLAPDQFGSATITIDLQDNGGTANGGVDTSPTQTFVITATQVNDAPSFTKGADQTISEDAGAQSVAGWATAISPGPNESSQTVHFNVTNDTNPGMFSVLPAISPTGTLSYTPAANGSATITIDLQDNGGTANGGVDTSPTQTFVITVTKVNDAPSFTKGPDQSPLEDTGAHTVPAWATAISPGPPDEAAQAVHFNVTNDTNAALFSVAPAISPTGTLTYTLAPDQFGSATITIDVQDDGGTANGGVDTSPTQTFVIAATQVNDAPSFTKGADQTVPEDSGAQTVNAWATAISAGPNEGSQTVHFNVTGDDNAGLFSAAPAISPAGDLTYTPAANTSGSATITIDLQDNGGVANGGVDTSPTQTFVINVSFVNDAPSFTKGADNTQLEDTGAHTVTGWATGISPGPANESGQTVQFHVTGNDNPALFSAGPAISPTGTLSYTLAGDQFGAATITITLQDNGGTANGGVDTSPPQTFVITATQVNDAPSFTKGADQSITEDSGAQSITGWATAISAGPNEGAQTLHFNVTKNTNPALFSALPAISPTGTLSYAPATSGSATITIDVQDNGGTANGGVDTSPPQMFVITVGAVNDAPSFTKGPDESPLEDTGAHTVTSWATAISPGPPDESGQTVHFNVTGNDNPALFSAGPAISPTGDLSYTLAGDQFGSATITITLQDNGGTANGGVDTSPPQTFVIAATQVNDAPSFTKGADENVVEGTGAHSVPGWATAISAGPNEGAQTVHFNVTNNTNPALFSVSPAVSPTGTLTYTLATSGTGFATITLTLQDDGGTANGGQDTSAPQSFVITVAPPDPPPTVQSTTPISGATTVPPGSTITVTFDEVVTFTNSSFKLECPTGTPETFNATGSGSTVATLTPSANLPGDVVCTVTVIANQITDTDTLPGDHLASDFVFSFTVAPVAVNDADTATGNIAITQAAPGVLANDQGSNLAVHRVQGLTANVGAPTATTGGGSVTLNADGSFTYDPPVGQSSGTDTFTYTVADGANESVPATVTVTMSNILWFVCQGCTSSNSGTLLNPFTSTGAFSTNNTGATGKPQDNQPVFIESGTYGGASDTLVLRAGQTITGQGASAATALGASPAAHTVAAFAALTAGTKPVLAPTSGNGVTLKTGNTIQYFDIGGVAAGASHISGTSFGTATVAHMAISGTGEALNLTTGTLNGTFDSIASTSSAAQGLSLTSVAGTFASTGGTTISGSTTQCLLVSGSTVSADFGNTSCSGGTDGISLQNNSSGTRTFGTLSVSNNNGEGFVHTKGGGAVGGGTTTVNGATTLTNPAGIGVDIQNSNAAVTFTGVTVDKSVKAGPGVSLASNTGEAITFGSLSVTTSAGPALSASGGGMIGTTGGTLSASGDSAIVADAITFAAGSTLTSASAPLNCCFSSISLTNVSGPMTIAGGSIVGNSAVATFLISGGTPTFTYNGTITQTHAQRAVDIQGVTAGTTTLGGSISGTGSTGVFLNNNTGATIAFTGAITLSTGASPAFTATGGGTVTATASTSTLTTTTATALNVANTTIGAGGLKFQSISAGTSSDTAGDGIILDTTGSTGGLTVTGTGTTAGTGGTIQHKTGADLSRTNGIGIYLNATSDVQLNDMQLNDFQNFAVRGFSVNGFALTHSVVNGTNGNNPANNGADDAGEGSLYFGNTTTNGLTGTVTVSDDTIGGGRARNFSNTTTSGTLHDTFNNDTFQLNQNFSDANQSLLMEARGSGTTVNSTLTNSTFAGAPGGDVNFTGQTATIMNVTMHNNTLSDTHAQNTVGGGSLTLATQGQMIFDVNNNTMTGANGSAVTMQLALAGTDLEGSFDTNTIGTSGVANSGAKTGNGIFLSAAGAGTITLAITNNTIQDYSGNGGIYMDNTGGSYPVNVTITGNTVRQPGAGAFAGLALTNGAQASGDTTNVFANISNNDFSTGDPSNANDIIVGASGSAASSHTFTLSGAAASDVASFAAIQTFLQNSNNLNGAAATTAVTAYTDSPVTVSAFKASSSSPPLPPPPSP